MSRPTPPLGPLASAVVQRFGARLAVLGLRLESSRFDPGSFGDEYARFSGDQLHLQILKDRGIPAIELQPRDASGTADAVELLGLLGLLRSPPLDTDAACGLFGDVLDLLKARPDQVLALLVDWRRRRHEAWTSRARLSGPVESFTTSGPTMQSPGGVVLERLPDFRLRYSEPGRSATVGYEFLVGVGASIVVYVSGVRFWTTPPEPATDADRLRIGRNILAAYGDQATLG